MSQGPPLPLPRPEARVVAVGVELVEGDEGGAVFVWGNAAWCWQPGDVAARRLAAVQLVVTGAAAQREAAEAFGVNENTVWRWRSAYEAGGVAALTGRRRGPRGPSKLTDAKIAAIVAARGQGLSMQRIAEQVGVSLNSVSRALRSAAAPAGAAPPAGAERDDDAGDAAVAPDGGLVALAPPAARTAERQAARAGLLAESPPLVTQGAGLPLAGALLVLPGLAATGLLEAAEAVYGRTRKACYGLRSLLLTVAFAALVGQPRAEGLCRIDPVDVGRLLGLDRAPEVKTLRRRLGELAAAGKADRLLGELAARHVAANTDAAGLFCVDGHVRAYHGRHDVPKAHLARMRLSMPAETDIWVADGNGDGVLVWQAPLGASLAGELRAVTRRVARWSAPTRGPRSCSTAAVGAPSCSRNWPPTAFTS